jgi:flagellar L-ring protein precursor FlgH
MKSILAFTLAAVAVVLGAWTAASAQPAQFPPRPPAYQFDPSLNPPPEPAPPYGHSVPQPFPGGMTDPYSVPPPRPWQPPNLQNPSAPQLLPVPPTQLPAQPAVPPLPGGDYSAFERPLLMPNHSWIFIEAAAPREIHVHDIVTIIVKEISESAVDARFNRQRRGTLLAELGEFVRIGETGNLVSAAENEPTIDGNLNARLDATGRVTERELMVYRIAATVVDVLPNGNLVLEARKQIASNGDLWEHTLTGTIRSVDINRDNTCLSENIADLRIGKRLSGRVHDSTRRAWGVRLLDKIFPF